MQYHHLIPAGFLLLTLACSPLTGLLEFNQNQQALATLETLIDSGDYLALTAYQKLHKLPGYRVEGSHTARARSGETATHKFTIIQDSVGNSHAIDQSAAGQISETYLVEGHTYYFSPQDQGWIRAENAAARPDLTLLELPHQWLAQLGVVPTEAGQEQMLGRSATRYTLKYILPELTAALGYPGALSGNRLQGALWVDDETGALLKSEILLFEGDSRQPSQEFVLQVTQVDAIEPISAPAPVVDPGGMAAATATAQAWSSLQVTLPFEGQPLTFELIPVQIRPTAEDTAEMQLVLQSLPPEVSAGARLDAFLVALGAQLKLSIPQKNLTADSTHFQLTQTNADTGAVNVSYYFNAALDDFSHVELILAAGGNPIFAPVPVAGQ